MNKYSLQQNFCKVLMQKRIELKEQKQVLNDISISAIGRWQSEEFSPTLKKMEEILKANNIELPFFYDGKIENAIKFAVEKAAEKGMKLTFNIEKL